MELELRPYDDHRTARIVDAFTEQVLPETALLTAQQVGKRTERTIRTRVYYRSASPTVVDKCVDGLLQHPFFVTDDHLGCALRHKFFEAVVAVDQAAVEVVQVRSGEASTLDLYHRAQRGGHDRDGL